MGMWSSLRLVLTSPQEGAGEEDRQGESPRHANFLSVGSVEASSSSSASSSEDLTSTSVHVCLQKQSFFVFFRFYFEKENGK